MFINKEVPAVITTTIKEVIRGLDERETVEVLAAGIDKALGTGSSRLVFKTLKLVYDFDVTPKSIRMREFDVLLAKLVGEIGYHHIVRSIFKEMGLRRRTGHHESC